MFSIQIKYLWPVKAAPESNVAKWSISAALLTLNP
jgi:hypothetical protein